MHTEVRLRYDAGDDPDHQPRVGSFLVTPRGTTYFIATARQGPSGIWSMTCLRWPPDEVEADARVLPLFWKARNRSHKR